MYQPGRPTLRRTPAWITSILIVWCVIVFIFLRSHPDARSSQTVVFGWPSDEQIFQGSYWGLVTTAFVHVEPLHLLFNLYWLWILGGVFERRFGSAMFLVFVVMSAFVSSGVQLMSGATGIGLSGVGYGLFGFAWIARTKVPEFARIVNDRTVMIFIAWGIFCIIATNAGMMRVANLAHAGGLAFGVGVALARAKEENRLLALLGLSALAAVALLPVFWNPKSPAWIRVRVAEAYTAGRYDEALTWCEKLLSVKGSRDYAAATIAAIAIKTGRAQDRDLYKRAVEGLIRDEPAAAAEVMKEYGVPEGLGGEARAPTP